MNTSMTLSVTEVKTLKDGVDPIFFLDVREDREVEAGHIVGSCHIPIADVPKRYNEIPKDVQVIVYCHLGGRSFKAVEFLRSIGYANTWSMTGGIHEWSQKVDPTLIKHSK